jgi:hypothetical protein
MSAYYGWRDIGTAGLRRTAAGPEINLIDTGNNSNNNGDNSNRSSSDKYCSSCGCKFIYSTKIRKWFCPERGCNLTKEESDILLGKAASSQQQQTTTTAFEKQAKSLLDDLEPGIGGGFIPMQRAGNTDVIGRQEGDGGGYTMTLPSRKKDKGGGGGGGYYTTPSGEVIELDSEQQKRVDKGYTILEAYTHLPEPTGSNIMESLTPEELRQQEDFNRRYNRNYNVNPDGSDNSQNGLGV